jgi:ketosteroid isomerase-like protein
MVEARNGRITKIRPFCWDTAAIVNACAEPTSRA